MLRYLSILMSVYVLLLIAVPCGEDIIQQSRQQSFLTEQHAEPLTEHHDCSPFCSCNFSKIPTLFAYKGLEIPAVFTTNFVPLTYPIVKEALLPNTVLDIWQPPKLS